MWIWIVAIGFIVRVVIIELSSINDNYYQGVFGQFTDLDYKVYIDATLYQSPYERHTYRYSPLLALIMQPTYQVRQTFGKIVIAIFDAFATYFAYKLYIKRKGKSAEDNSFLAKLVSMHYGWNPFFIYLSIRGSCQGITVTLWYAFWYFYFGQNTHGNMSAFERRDKGIVERQPNTIRKYISYIIFGLWVHFRVFPIILVPLLIMHEYHSVKQNKIKHTLKFIVEFGLVAGGVFVALAAYFYYLYGYDFLHQTYFYHLTRRDNRHSCSAFFYQIYLNYEADSMVSSLFRTIFRMLPSLLAIFVVSFVFVKNYSLIFCSSYIILLFISFNKVITSQYFMWDYCAVHLLFSEIDFVLQRNWKKILGAQAFAAPAVFLWRYYARKVQNSQGEYTLQHIWYCSFILVATHIMAFCYIASHSKPYESITSKTKEVNQSIKADDKKD